MNFLLRQMWKTHRFIHHVDRWISDRFWFLLWQITREWERQSSRPLTQRTKYLIVSFFNGRLIKPLIWVESNFHFRLGSKCFSSIFNELKQKSFDFEHFRLEKDVARDQSTVSWRFSLQFKQMFIKQSTDKFKREMCYSSCLIDQFLVWWQVDPPQSFLFSFSSHFCSMFTVNVCLSGDLFAHRSSKAKFVCRGTHRWKYLFLLHSSSFFYLFRWSMNVFMWSLSRVSNNNTTNSSFVKLTIIETFIWSFSQCEMTKIIVHMFF